MEDVATSEGHMVLLPWLQCYLGLVYTIPVHADLATQHTLVLTIDH